MLPIWQGSLAQKLRQPQRNERLGPPRTCLLGVGHDLCTDDAAGLLVARALSADARLNPVSDLLILEGGPAPENQTGRIRAFQPELVLIVDAVHLQTRPGDIQWIPLDAIDGFSASSHSLPLSILAQFLQAELNCEVAVLGIQPESNVFIGELSDPVQAAIDQIVTTIRDFFIPLPEPRLNQQ